MSLTSLWKSQEGELAGKHIQAVVSWAGDGNRPKKFINSEGVESPLASP